MTTPFRLGIADCRLNIGWIDPTVIAIESLNASRYFLDNGRRRARAALCISMCLTFGTLTRRRTRGLGLFHSGDALPNFLTVWTSGVLILFNLDRFSIQPVLAPWPYFFLALALPMLLLLGTIFSSHEEQRRANPAPTSEALEEGAEVDI